MKQKISNKEKWIVDTDPGCDDMIALLYLFGRPEIDVLMVSLVEGNVCLDHVTINAKKIIKMSGKQFPIYRGSSNPILRSRPFATYHYCDGLGDIEEIKNYNADDIKIESESSIIKLIEFVKKYPNEINLLCLGPLTNVATAYMLSPDISRKFKRIYMMGGSYLSRGNSTATTEFNFCYDYISTKIVLSNFKNIIITPWEPTFSLIVNNNRMNTISSNIKTKNLSTNELIFKFASLIVSKFTSERKVGTKYCDLYSIIPAFAPESVRIFSLCRCDIVIDSVASHLGMLCLKTRKIINKNYDSFVKNELEKLQESGFHLIIEEFDDTVIFDECGSIFIQLNP